MLKAKEYLETQTGWFNQNRIADYLQKDFRHLNEGIFSTDGLVEHIFLKELASVAQVYFNVHGILHVPMEASVSATADKLVETATFSERVSRAFAGSRSFEDIFFDISPHLYNLISGIFQLGILRLGPLAAIGVGIGALAIGLVKVGSIISNLPGKAAFKEAVLYNIEIASAEMKMALHQLEPELERVIREKILPQTALFN